MPLKSDKIHKMLELLVQETEKSRQICRERRLKFSYRGKEVIVQDVADKLPHWIDRFKNIGNIFVQYNPVHAALPWAGIRFLLQFFLFYTDLNDGINCH